MAASTMNTRPKRVMKSNDDVLLWGAIRAVKGFVSAWCPRTKCYLTSSLLGGVLYGTAFKNPSAENIVAEHSLQYATSRFTAQDHHGLIGPQAFVSICEHRTIRRPSINFDA